MRMIMEKTSCSGFTEANIRRGFEGPYLLKMNTDEYSVEYIAERLSCLVEDLKQKVVT